MALEDALAIDPQSVVSGLLAERMPDLAQNGQVDPQMVLNRLLRKAQAQHQAQQQQTQAEQQPVDYSQFGVSKENAQPPVDFSQFGQTPEQAAQPQQPAQEGTLAKIGSVASDVWNAATSPSTYAPIAQGALAGLKSGAIELGQGEKALIGQPSTPAPKETSPYAQGYEWSDLVHPLAQGLPKLAFQMAKSAPTLMGAIAGGIGGAGVAPESGPVGPAIGAATGAAMVGALQQLGPRLADELQKNPADPEAAWSRAIKSATESGEWTGASFLAFGIAPFQSAVKNILFQTLGVQGGIGAAQQATENVEQGQPLTQGLGQAYAQGAIGTAVPLAAHAVLSRLMRGAPETRQPQQTPKTEEEITPPGPEADINQAFEDWKKQYEGREGTFSKTQTPDGRWSFKFNPREEPPPGPEAEQPAPGPEPGPQPAGGGGGAGAETAADAAGTQAPGARPTGAQAAQPKPPPFATKLHPRIRATLEEAAVNQSMRAAGFPDELRKGYSPAERRDWSATRQKFADQVASWSDDKLKGFVGKNTGYGAERADDDEILRHYGFTDDDIKGMSPEEKAANVEEAQRKGTPTGEPQAEPGTREAPVNLKQPTTWRKQPTSLTRITPTRKERQETINAATATGTV